MDLSPFEQLPGELFGKIVDHVPESVAALSLTAYCIHNQMNKYVIQRSSLTLVEEVGIYSTRDSFPPHQPLLIASMFVEKTKSDLFEMRLKQLIPEMIKQIRRRNASMTNNPNVYTIQFPSPLDNDSLEQLRNCFGKRIGHANLINCNLSTTLSAVSQLLVGIEFDKLEFTTETLSEEAVDFIKTAIKDHKVEKLGLSVSTAPNLVQLLLDLSSLVRSLHIYQCAIEGTDHHMDWFLGLLEFDWAPTILEMFSNKMDKLLIENRRYQGYLNTGSSDMLREHLPTLGKKIWCFISCNNYQQGLDYMENDHFVQANSQYPSHNRYLRVRHSSRKAMRDYSLLSPFENFPCEVFWKIFDYVPESVFELRLTSRLLFSRVNEYALKQTALVEELNIYQAWGPFSVSMFVHKSKSNLFEQRLKLGFSQLVERIERNGVKTIPGHNVYTMKLTAPYTTLILNVDSALEELGNAIGKRVGLVNLIYITEQATLDAVTILLEGMEFSTMEITAKALSDEAAAHLKTSVVKHSVDKLALNLGTAPDLEQLLLDLSMLVRSLHLFQRSIIGTGEKVNCLFSEDDVVDGDWAPVILKMFSGKLDKLMIENRYYQGFMGVSRSDLLKERLPKLGKAVWYSATCDNYEEGLDYAHMDYVVQVEKLHPDHTDPFKPNRFRDRFLSIKHQSRAQEGPDFSIIE